jgi:uncharacterized repeat protein (TIGR04042 family)
MQLNSSPFTIYYSPFTIYYLLFTIHHSPFTIYYSPSTIHHPLSPIPYPLTMPETRFKIQWPDGSEEICYSPSSIVKKYFESDRDYELADFIDRAQTALTTASDRVKAKYGRPCGLAIGQLAEIQANAAQFSLQPRPIVRVIKFIE